MKKGILISTAMLALPALSRACDVCSVGAQQPEFLRDLTHGTNPQGVLDYLIVAAMVVIVLLTLVYAIKYLVRPGERDRDHIKRTILTLENSGH